MEPYKGLPLPLAAEPEVMALARAILAILAYRAMGRCQRPNRQGQRNFGYMQSRVGPASSSSRGRGSVLCKTWLTQPST